MGTKKQNENGTIIEVVDYKALAIATLSKIDTLNNIAKDENENRDEYLIPRISKNMSITTVKTEIGFTVINATDKGLEIKIDGDTLLLWNGDNITFTYRGKTVEHYKDKEADKELVNAITKAHAKFFNAVNERSYTELCKKYYEVLETRYKDYVALESFIVAITMNGYDKTLEAIKNKALNYEAKLNVWIKETSGEAEEN